MKTALLLALSVLALPAHQIFAVNPADQAQSHLSANLPCPLIGPAGKVLPVGSGPLYRVNSAPPSFRPPAADDIAFQQIATTVAPSWKTMAGGDSDGDSLFEAYFDITDSSGIWLGWTYRGYENNGFNVYQQAFNTNSEMIPYAYGEIDGDNKPEVIGQVGYNVKVFESPQPGQYASQLVWQSPNLDNVVGYTAVGDLDQDGHWEIIQSQNSLGPDNRLVIFENTGDNQYTQIYNQWISNMCTGQKAVADFDGDGLWEVALSAGNGQVYVYESRPGNQFQQTFYTPIATSNSYSLGLSHDGDGNGRPEFVVTGCDVGPGWQTYIFEANGNDNFVLRQEIDIPDNYLGEPAMACGDVDGDGYDEIVIQSSTGLHIYKFTGQQWTQVGLIPPAPGGGQFGVFCFDSNNNGRDDIFWVGMGDGGYWQENTLVYESMYSPPPAVDITLIPQNPPIVIPPGGGSFNYAATLANYSAGTQTFQAWIKVQLPSGTWYGPVQGPVSVTLSPGVSLTRPRTQSVPAAAPAGQYTYRGYVGAYPAKWDSSSFTFTKSGIEVSGMESGDWLSAGEPFSGESDQALITHDSSFLTTVSPNPFNPTTALSYELRAVSYVSLRVYDTAGRLVGTLVDGMQEAGQHRVTFDGSGLSSGVYLAKLQAAKTTELRKLLLVK